MSSGDTTRFILDPGNESKPAIRRQLPRLPDLAGRSIGLLDISKARGDLFLDRLEIPAGARCAELGCGPGLVLGALRERAGHAG